MVFSVPAIDYTTRDFESTRDDLIRLIPFFTPEWTNHNETDFGIVLVELFSYISDIMHFYIDQRAAEGFLTTAVTRPSVINLLKLIDFDIPGANAATVDLEFTLESILTGDLVIPQGTQVQSAASEISDAVLFETVQALVIPAGDLVGTVGARQGETVTELLEESDGTAFQRRTLTETEVLRTSIRFFANETGVEEEWEEIDSLANADIGEKVFEVILNDDDSISILLGDSGQGRIPITSSPLRTEYVIGGGLIGNVGADTITQLVSTILFLGNPVSIEVTNPAAASGGEEAMSIEEAKRLGPQSFKTFNRAVTLEDHEVLALRVPGVSKAKAVIEDTIARVINIFIAAAGTGVPSAALIQNTLDFFEDKRMAGTTIQVFGPNFIDLQIVGTVVVEDNFSQVDVQQLVDAAIQDFFSLDDEDTDFGIGAFLSDIYALIDNVEGVNHVDLFTSTLDPASTIELVIWSGDAVIENFVISETTEAETWTINFTSATDFTVTGSVSGVQTNTGTVNSIYVSDNSEIQFEINNSGTPQQALDRATFRTSRILDNVALLFNEIRTLGSINLTFEGGI